MTTLSITAPSLTLQDRMHFVDEVRRLRDAQNLRYKDLSRILGMSTQCVGYWISGRGLPTSKNVEGGRRRIAQYLVAQAVQKPSLASEPVKTASSLAPGLSVRTRVATAVINGLLANPGFTTRETDVRDVVDAAVGIADQLLESLES